jgi:hypothetical protein
MDSKENERFNKILISGYEELLRNKPASPEEHFIHYLLRHISPEVRQTDPTLDSFFTQYSEQLKTTKTETNNLIEGAAQNYNKTSSFDYDLFIVGNGLAGVSAAIMASYKNAKVAIADYTIPSS